MIGPAGRVSVSAERSPGEKGTSAQLTLLPEWRRTWKFPPKHQLDSLISLCSYLHFCWCMRFEIASSEVWTHSSGCFSFFCVPTWFLQGPFGWRSTHSYSCSSRAQDQPPASPESHSAGGMHALAVWEEWASWVRGYLKSLSALRWSPPRGSCLHAAQQTLLPRMYL